MTKLFEPIKIGDAQLGHRIAMGPMTRFRCTEDRLPMENIVKEYYEQRSCVPGTLIISEAILISEAAAGAAANAPGLWTAEQVAAWRPITDAVHAKGSLIYCQLWHQGRAGGLRYKGAKAPEGDKAAEPALYSSSAVPVNADTQVPVALTEEQIWQTIEDYAAAARNAMAAGFDGVEIHGANGYLPDQFLQTTCNQRTDGWGGSIENRSRFHLEVTNAVVAAVGAKRVGMRLSPYSDFGGMLMEDPDPTFRYLATKLREAHPDLAFLHLIEARISGNVEADCGGQESVDWLVRLWDNVSPVLLNGGFTPESGKKAVDETFADYDVVMVYGRPFVSNPDFVFRVREGLDILKHDRSVFFAAKDPKGYADYPFSPQFVEASRAA